MARSLKESGLRIRRLPGTSMFYRNTDRQYEEDIKLQHHIADEVRFCRCLSVPRVKYRRPLTWLSLEQVIQKRIDHPSDHDDLLNKMLKGKDVKTGTFSWSGEVDSGATELDTDRSRPDT
jgi:hypothetical protein